MIEHIQEMVPFEKLIQETLCLMKCKEGKIPQNRDEFASQSTRADFEAKKPYDYLQLCYYKTNDLQKAAEAAYTNHIYNRENLVMVENLNYYLSLPEVEEGKVVDVEEEDYVASYLTATDQYRAEDWQGMVATMETALQQFLAAEESCRLSCDKPFDMGWWEKGFYTIPYGWGVNLHCGKFHTSFERTILSLHPALNEGFKNKTK